MNSGAETLCIIVLGLTVALLTDLKNMGNLVAADLLKSLPPSPFEQGGHPVADLI